ncbi:MAG: hypothetical protein LC725_12470 [Lentisphaerae bacterium]|nr:hypothetical protein [Lentisphaerota bacterium]
MKTILIKFALVSILGMFSGCFTSTQQMNKRVQSSSSWGFVSEIDEPSSRGVLKKVSPDESDVRGRFCVSPNGEMLVFAGIQGRHSYMNVAKKSPVQLWKIPVSGGAPVKITSGGEEDCEYPSFTPDGKHIVYSSGGTLWRIQQNGAGGRTRIPGSGIGSDFAPHVASDGRIVFCSLQMRSRTSSLSPNFFIWICDADGGNLTQLREGAFPMWSPDASSIVFTHDGDIWSVTADGTELTQLTNNPRIFEGLPTFSDDGKFIVYASNEGRNGKPMSNDFNIWRMRVNGSEKTQLTELKSWDSWPLQHSRGVFFLSARAAIDMQNKLQRIWRLEMQED